MKTKEAVLRGFLRLGVVIVLGVIATASSLCQAAQFTAGPGSTLWLEGESTLHPFKSTATVMDAKLDVTTMASDSAGLLDALKKGNAKTLQLSIPVTGLKSGEKGLDRNMYKALKAENNPTITFQMTQYDFNSSTATGDSVHASGKLSIAGVEKTVEMQPAVGMLNGRISISGEQKILMSEYGVKPPTLMFGAIKVADRIVVKFQLSLEQVASGIKEGANHEARKGGIQQVVAESVKAEKK